MHDVFISYAHEERALARKLAEALLAARGWSVWWDTSLRTGEQFPKRIQDAVAASRCVVVLWSKHSVDSNWVVAEASEGWERQVLAPVLLDGSEPPMPFRQTQARDLSQWHGAANDASLLALIEDIQRIHAQGAVIDTAELEEREQRRRAFKRARTMRRAYPTSTLPASVSARSCASRAKSGAPTSSSSFLMLWLIAGCVRDIRSAARVKLPSSTTARKCSSCSRSIAFAAYDRPA